MKSLLLNGLPEKKIRRIEALLRLNTIPMRVQKLAKKKSPKTNPKKNGSTVL